MNCSYGVEPVGLLCLECVFVCMRRFENRKIERDRAEALTSSLRDIPSQNAKDARSYIKQFIEVYGSEAELFYGYLPEEYADGLVEIREANSNYDLNAIVGQLCVDGATSEKVTDYDEFAKITLESSRSMIEELTEVYRDVTLDETRTMIGSARDIIRNSHRDQIELYVPKPVGEELAQQINSL